MSYAGTGLAGAGLGSSADAAAAGLRSMRAVAALTQAALDAAIIRQLCYLSGESGCGRFALNEDEGHTKASQEERAVVTPLMRTAERAARFLVERGQPSAEVGVVQAKLRTCTAMNDYIDAKFNEMSGRDPTGRAAHGGVPYHDPHRRNNLRGEIIGAGRRLVACLGSVRAFSSAGRALIRSAIERALAGSRMRKNCYLTPGTATGSGCNKSGEIEPNHLYKGAEEDRHILRPLETLLARPLSAMGEVDQGSSGLSVSAWLGIGTAVLIGAAVLSASKSPRKNRRRRVRRRTSRRVR